MITTSYDDRKTWYYVCLHEDWMGGEEYDTRTRDHASAWLRFAWPCGIWEKKILQKVNIEISQIAPLPTAGRDYQNDYTD